MRLNARVFSSIVAVMATLTVLPEPALAQDDLILLSRLAGPTTISLDFLMANDLATSGPSTMAFFPPSRGSLSVTPTAVIYTPDPKFHQFGLDSFQYIYQVADEDQNKAPLQATVFLVADLKVTLAVPGPPGGSANGWTTVNLPIQPTASPQGQSFTVTVGGPASYLEYVIPADPQPVTGGTMAHNVDGDLCPGCETTISSIVFGAVPGFELRLNTLNQVYARAWLDDGSYVDTASFSTMSGRLELTWWLEYAEGAENGGLILTVDNQIAEELTDLENYSFSGASTIFHRVGSLNSTLASGQLIFSNLQIWTSALPLRYPPRLAEGAENSTFDSWSTVNLAGQIMINPSVSSLHQQTFMILTGVGTTAAMVHNIDDSENSLRLRFMLDPYSMTDGMRTFVVTADDPADSVPAFRVELIRRSSYVKLRVRATQDSGPQAISSWLSFPDSTGPLHVDVAWWAATANSQGRIDLSVTGVTTKSVSTPLTNTASLVNQLNFGASNTTNNTIFVPFKGSFLLLDDIEIWY